MPRITRPKAYSYLRFSTPEQSKGDSFRRQLDLSRKYAEQHGLELDEGEAFKDLGVSGYHGLNATEGALSVFISEVDAGRVPSGSYLLVESLDRLSRDRISAALELLMSLLRRQVIVVTLSDNKVYTEDSLNNLSDLIVSLTIMARAHEESAMKSRRVRAAWQKKRDQAATGNHILTTKAPAWLRLNRDAEAFEVIEDRAELIQRLFAMTLEGYGKAAIASKLNSEGVEPFGDGPSNARKANGWHPSYIQKILDNPATIGRFQPMRLVTDPNTGKKSREPEGDVIEDYFPAVVEPGVFHRARHLRRSRRTVSGPKGETFSNLLSGLATCGLCGMPMHFVNKGRPPKGRLYLACSDARRKVGDCKAPSVRYDVVLEALLNSLDSDDLDLRNLVGLSSSDADNRHRQELLGEVETVEGLITEAQEGNRNLVALAVRTNTPASQTMLAAQIDDLSNQEGVLNRRKEQLEEELHALTYDSASREDTIADVERLVQEWNNVLRAAEDDPSRLYDLNVRFNAALKRLIENVAVYRSEAAREWTDGVIANGHIPPLPKLVRSRYRKVIDESVRGVSMTVNFRGHSDDRHLIIYADGTKPKRYVALALRLNEDGVVDEGILAINTGT